MSSLGRGRARSLKESDIGGLRRPGELNYTWELVKTIDCMEIDERKPTNEDSIVVLVSNKLKEMCTSVDIMEQLIQSLHHYSLQNLNFGKKCAAVFGAASMLAVDGTKLRSVLLTRLQLDYEEHEKIQKRDPSKFLNMVYFLGQIFERVRLKDGSQMQVLAGPNITYLGILLQGRGKQLEIFTSLMLLNGHALEVFNEMEFQLLLNKIREILFENSLGPALNACLMVVLEFSNYGFKDVPDNILKFYSSQIKYASVLQFLIPKDCEWSVNEITKEDRCASTEKTTKHKFVSGHDDRHEVSYENLKSVIYKKL